MKLDLLYEVQAPKPWPDKPYPYDQREAEQAAYFEAIEQIKLADKLGFGTVWVVEHHFRIERSHMPDERARSSPRCRRSPTRSVSASASRSRRTSSATRSTPRRRSPPSTC